jgi:hypothetical protein
VGSLPAAARTSAKGTLRLPSRRWDNRNGRPRRCPSQRLGGWDRARDPPLAGRTGFVNTTVQGTNPKRTVIFDYKRGDLVPRDSAHTLILLNPPFDRRLDLRAGNVLRDGNVALGVALFDAVEGRRRAHLMAQVDCSAGAHRHG